MYTVLEYGSAVLFVRWEWSEALCLWMGQSNTGTELGLQTDIFKGTVSVISSD